MILEWAFSIQILRQCWILSSTNCLLLLQDSAGMILQLLYYLPCCQILGLVARIRNNEVHNNNEAQKMTMELMIDCLATLRDVW